GGGSTVALVADPRNEAHHLISQLTVLFARFHNAVAARVAAHVLNGRSGFDRRRKAERIFRIARRIVLAVYRTIVWEDLCRRLLDEATYHRLSGALEKGNATEFRFARDGRVGPDVLKIFNTAGYRVGHAMVQDAYSISKAYSARPPWSGARTRPATIHEMILMMARRRGTLEPGMVVDWERFFFEPADLDGTGEFGRDGGAVNHSHPIGLSLPRAFGAHLDPLATEDAVRGGLGYRDLVRNEADGLAAATFLSAGSSPVGPVMGAAELRDALLEVLPRPARESPNDPSELHLTEGDIAELAEHLPLCVYILLEAQARGGEHLGPLGSVIVGEVMAAALLPDTPDTRDGLEQWKKYVGGDPPRMMTDLIDWLAVAEGRRPRRKAGGNSVSALVTNLNDEAVMQKAGALLRQWALGLVPIPKTAEERREALEAEGVRFQPSVTGVEVHQNTSTVMNIALPSATQLQGQLDRLGSYTTGAGYRLPHRFGDFLENADGYTKDQLLEFYDFRLGDYVLQHCD
ncbi:MAG TPA: peroxidase family protein, partial [Paracoccaceae bacterium]|nr:peroxidase family protein [Paracoccaceae bacterium]